MLKSIYYIFRYFPFYYKLFRDYKKTINYSKLLIAEVKLLFPNWNSVVNTENQKRMKDYILIQTLWTAGFCLLRGERIKDNELKAIVNISALAPFYDDFFDKREMYLENIHELIENPFEYNPKTDLERLFIEFSKRIHENVKDISLCLENAQKVFNAQYESKKLVSKELLDRKEVRRIAFNKGASTVICICNMLNKRLSEKEERLMFQLGGVAQYLDDVFDLREDYLEGRQTLVNPVTNIECLKTSFVDEVKSFKYHLIESGYSKSNRMAFYFPISFLLGATLLCFKRYEFLESENEGGFDVKNYSRHELVVDMDLWINRLKAFKLASKV